jgi:hypothetical protein
MTDRFATQGPHKDPFPTPIDIPLDDTLDRADLARLLASVECLSNCIGPRRALCQRSVPLRKPHDASPVAPIVADAPPAALQAEFPDQGGAWPQEIRRFA